MPQHMFENKPPQTMKEDSMPSSPQIMSSREVPPSLPLKQEQQMNTSEHIEPPQQQQPIKREPSDSDLPLPKRPPSKCHQF